MCLESRIPGAEGPVPLLHLGGPHPDHSEALQRVTQVPSPRELSAPLSHLGRENMMCGSEGGRANAGQN